VELKYVREVNEYLHSSYRYTSELSEAIWLGKSVCLCGVVGVIVGKTFPTMTKSRWLMSSTIIVALGHSIALGNLASKLVFNRQLKAREEYLAQRNNDYESYHSTTQASEVAQTPPPILQLIAELNGIEVVLLLLALLNASLLAASASFACQLIPGCCSCCSEPSATASPQIIYVQQQSPSNNTTGQHEGNV